MRKHIIHTLPVIVIGLVLIGITAFGTNQWYNNIAPTEHQILTTQSRADALALLQRSDEAGNIRTVSLVILGIEVLVTLGATINCWNSTPHLG